MFDVFRAWDYAGTIFQSEKLHISCLETDLGTDKYIFCICLCMLCDYSICVFYVFDPCTLCIYSMHVFQAYSLTQFNTQPSKVKNQ